MKLRPYQEEAVQSLYDYFSKESGNPLLVLPTASGKSVIQADFIRRAVEGNGQRVLCLSHVKELLQQNAEKLRAMLPFLDLGIYSAGLKKRDLGNKVVVAGIQSIHKRAAELGVVNLVIIDECHLVSPKGSGMYRSFLKDLTKINPKLKVIGLSATPYRMGTGLLHEGEGAIFTDVAYQADIKSLISDGYLSPLVSKTSTHRPDISNVPIRGGEYVAGALEAAVMDERVVWMAVTEIIALASDRKKWIVFCAGVAHATAVRDEFRNQGIATECVTGETPRAERDEMLRRFKAGEIRAITNVNVLTTGFDAPDIDLVAMLRPTKSTGLYVQQIGRGMRIAEGKKDCLVLDYAGNILEHGPIDLIRIRSKGEGGGVETAPMKECPECQAALLISLMICPECGYEYPVEEKAPHAPTADELDVISGESSIREFDVVKTIYIRHKKQGKPDSLRVIYKVGLVQQFSEWVCLEHGGFAAGKARRWWRDSVDRKSPDLYDGIPENVGEALSLLSGLREVAKIKVNTAGEYPEIISREFVPF